MTMKLKKGDAVKIKRGAFKAKGRYVRKVAGIGEWHDVIVVAKDGSEKERRYRTANITAS